MTNEQKKLWLPLLAIAGAMAIWGTILGIGAYLSPSGKYAGADVRKFLVLGHHHKWIFALLGPCADSQGSQVASPEPRSSQFWPFSRQGLAFLTAMTAPLTH